MPSPVLALPCGSKSTRRTRLPTAARAVARLTAVVVLRTPPFWLTIARIRARAVSSPAARSIVAAVACTDYPFEPQDDARGIGRAGQQNLAHLPLFARAGQFFPDPLPCGERRISPHDLVEPQAAPRPSR